MGAVLPMGAGGDVCSSRKTVGKEILLCACSSGGSLHLVSIMPSFTSAV